MLGNELFSYNKPIQNLLDYNDFSSIEPILTEKYLQNNFQSQTNQLSVELVEKF